MFKKFNRVVVSRVVTLNGTPQWEELVGREFVITSIAKTKGLETRYSLEDADSDDGYAWIWESQLELASECDLNEVKKRHKLYLENKQKENNERVKKMREIFEKLPTQKEKEIFMMITNPFAYALYQSVKNLPSIIARDFKNER